jgi:hypothetical protein
METQLSFLSDDCGPLEGYARAATELLLDSTSQELSALSCHDYVYLVL